MTRIIKVMQGTALFVKEQEFADEATAQIGEKPTEEKFIVTDIRMEFAKWKRKPKADQ